MELHVGTCFMEGFGLILAYLLGVGAASAIRAGTDVPCIKACSHNQKWQNEIVLKDPIE